MRSDLSLPLTLGLSLVLSGCATYGQRTPPEGSTFVYRSEDGTTAYFDTANMVIRSPYGTMPLVACSDADSICLRTTDARIEVPRRCAATSVEYIGSSPTLKLVSLEGLSGNVFKAEAARETFAYGYHFENGVVQLILLPPDGSLRVSTAGHALRPHIYRIVRGKGPFPCKC
jgi:hypothetical protein